MYTQCLWDILYILPLKGHVYHSEIKVKLKRQCLKYMLFVLKDIKLVGVSVSHHCTTTQSQTSQGEMFKVKIGNDAFNKY